MRFLVQRVNEADVSVDGQSIGRIGQGFLVLVGISSADVESGISEKIADKMVKKLIGLRIFSDEDGKTNLDLQSVQGQLLIISQFTLYADCRKGNRPSFIRAGAPEPANALYEYLIKECAKSVPCVRHGEFGADMKVSLTNDGPFTIILDSEELNI